MENKIILITGASDGIGKETAKALAKQGHTIIMHGRNPQKTKSVCEEVKAESGNDKIEYLTADFLSLAEVRNFADKVRQKYDRLDVLVNNAGAQFTGKRETTVEGHEKTMTINVFAPMLLTTLLLPLLRKSQSARVVTVAVSFGRKGNLPFSILNILQLAGWLAILNYDGALAANGIFSAVADDFVFLHRPF